MTAPPGGNGQSRSARFRNPRARIRSARMLKFKGDGTRMAGRSRAQRRYDENTEEDRVKEQLEQIGLPVAVGPQDDGTAGRQRAIQIREIPESPSQNPFGSHAQI